MLEELLLKYISNGNNYDLNWKYLKNWTIKKKKNNVKDVFLFIERNNASMRSVKA